MPSQRRFFVGGACAEAATHTTTIRVAVRMCLLRMEVIGSWISASIYFEVNRASGAVEVFVDALEHIYFEQTIDHVAGEVGDRGAHADLVGALFPRQVWSEGPAFLARSDGNCSFNDGTRRCHDVELP